VKNMLMLLKSYCQHHAHFWYTKMVGQHCTKRLRAHPVIAVIGLWLSAWSCGGVVWLAAASFFVLQLFGLTCVIRSRKLFGHMIQSWTRYTPKYPECPHVLTVISVSLWRWWD
jgi:hypothetical protein